MARYETGYGVNKFGFSVIDDCSDKPPQLLSEEYTRKFREELMKDVAMKGSTWIRSTPYHEGELIQRIDPSLIYLAKDGVRSVGGSLQPSISHTENPWWGRSIISHQEALNQGIDTTTLVHVSPDSDLYYKPAKEIPMPKTKQTKQLDYNTVGVRFPDGRSIAKVYTYRVPKKAKLYLGQEVIVPTDEDGTGYITQSVAYVVRIDKEKQDIDLYDYKFVTGTIKPL